MGGASMNLSALSLPGLLWKIQEALDEAESIGLSHTDRILIEKRTDDGKWTAVFHCGK